MPSLIICTPGGATDNCYVTLEQANTFFSLGLRNDEWQNWVSTDRERALIQATAEIEDLGGARRSVISPARPNFPDLPYNPSILNGVALQALHFPRRVDVTWVSGTQTKLIPTAVTGAVCEQAFWLLQKRDAPDLVNRDDLQAQGVKSFSTDGISETYGFTDLPLGISPLAWKFIKPLVTRAYGVS